MDKNLTKNQILLIVIATVLLLLAAFSFYLLQDPTAPLPFVPPPPTSTFTPLPATPTDTPTPSATPIPTRRTSYTPFASPDRTDIGTPPEETITPVTLIPESSGTTTSLACIQQNNHTRFSYQYFHPPTPCHDLGFSNCFADPHLPASMRSLVRLSRMALQSQTWWSSSPMMILLESAPPIQMDTTHSLPSHQARTSAWHSTRQTILILPRFLK